MNKQSVSNLKVIAPSLTLIEIIRFAITRLWTGQFSLLIEPQEYSVMELGFHCNIYTYNLSFYQCPWNSKITLRVLFSAFAGGAAQA